MARSSCEVLLKQNELTLQEVGDVTLTMEPENLRFGESLGMPRLRLNGAPRADGGPDDERPSLVDCRFDGTTLFVEINRNSVAFQRQSWLISWLGADGRDPHCSAGRPGRAPGDRRRAHGHQAGPGPPAGPRRGGVTERLIGSSAAALQIERAVVRVVDEPLHQGGHEARFSRASFLLAVLSATHTLVPRRTGRVLVRCRAHRSVSTPPVSPGGGDGLRTSHNRGTRTPGSAASRLCIRVLPVRENPTTKMGRAITSSAMPG